jgi:lysophospholipase L1-like esterase
MKGSRLVSAIAIALAACLVFTLAGPASARKVRRAKRNSPVVKGSGYLSLGDSVTFGFLEPNTVPPPNYRNAASFVAYPAMVGKQLRLKITNAGCPGETSASFINASAQSNGCENSLGSKTGYRTLYPLHVRYKGSQLAFTIRYLKRHRRVRLVSLMIGANDVFLCQKTTKDGCLNPSEQKAVFSNLSKNVRRILSAIRNKARYRGQIVLVNYYSLNYASSLFNGVSQGLNAAMNGPGRVFRAKVANGYGEFQRATRLFGGNTCRAGLITLLSTRSCGVHPTYAGHGLLAQAVIKTIRI